MTAEKIYVYGFIPTNELNKDTFPEHVGFDETANLYPLIIDRITAVVSPLDSENYTEEIIEDKISNDIAWLQEKAFHHHEVLMMLNKFYTVIPLSFCTIYNSEDRVIEVTSSQADELQDSFKEIAGREEWNLKIYYDEAKLKEEVHANNPNMKEKRDEIENLSPGKQFFEKKKLDKLAEKEMEKELNTRCETVHHTISEMAVRADVKKLLGKDATGRKDAMSWNGVYLIEKSNVDDFITTVTEKEKELNQSGLNMEATGPWPAYHFSNLHKVEK